jgi:hypothetical protein
MLFNGRDATLRTGRHLRDLNERPFFFL